MKRVIVVLSVLVVGCAAPVKESSPIVQAITADTIGRHHSSLEGQTPHPTPWHREDNGELRMSYGRSCFLRVARGGQILPESRIKKDRNRLTQAEAEFAELLAANRETMSAEDYENAKTGHSWFTAIMAGDDATRYPEIGARALYVGVWDGDTLTFTTSDERYDVEITCIFGGDGLTSVVELAKEISDAYDMKTESRTKRSTE